MDEPTSPWMALGIRAVQETDTTFEIGDTDIKPRTTVDAIIVYELLYPGKPVILTN